MDKKYGEHIHHHVEVDVSDRLACLLEKLTGDTETEGQLSQLITRIKAGTKSNKARFAAFSKGIRDAIK